MGWLPAADSILHAGLVGYVIASIFASDEPEAETIKASCIGYSVQIDPWTLSRDTWQPMEALELP